jgi:hypothetical protein
MNHGKDVEEKSMLLQHNKVNGGTITKRARKAITATFVRPLRKAIRQTTTSTTSMTAKRQDNALAAFLFLLFLSSDLLLIRDSCFLVLQR